MGFGLYATSRLVNNIGLEFIVHSGHHKLVNIEGNTSVIENGFWQGTIVYMSITTSTDIDPNYVVDNRTNVEEQYNEMFVESEEIESLW